jgi:outer membrane receptor protein involved in Fe transport
MRTLIVAALALALVGPLSMATSFAQAPAAAQGASQTAGSISGTIKDAGGAPVAGAQVKVTGPTTQTTTSDAQGNFSIGNLQPGIYSFGASKAGYNSATESAVTVLAGQSQALTVTMSAVSFSTLRTIASVRAAGRGTFNTTPASISIVSSQQIQEQGATQVMQVLNQTPGIVASLPSSSANAAAPGAITVPNIRGALSFETASLIDGHPLSVGTYGDYVTTFLNPFMLNAVELVKGPGVASPEVNYAIGGTVNFVTKEPTPQLQGLWQTGFDNYGGNIVNVGVSDTLNRLGFVLAYSNDNLETAVQNYQALIPFSGGPQVGVVNWNPAAGTGYALGYNDSSHPITTPQGPTYSKVYNNYGLVACCYPLASLYNNQSELAKLRYRFSNATSATFTYLGSQTWANQAANTSSYTPSTFQPTGGTYSGSIPAGSTVNAAYVRTGNDSEINNEPILEGEIRSTVHNDTVLARYYAAGIERLIHQGGINPNSPDVYMMNLYGYDSSNGVTYNGSSTEIAVFDYYNQQEIDKLQGYTLEYDHPFAAGADNLTASYDLVNSTTVSCGSGISNGPSAGHAFNSSNVKWSPSCQLPQGSGQLFGTFLTRVNMQLRPNLNFQLANYLNSYKSTYPFENVPGKTCSAAVNGTNCIFNTTTHTHEDARAALEYRPTTALAVRLAAGSAIAPPYLALLDAVQQKINYSSGIATQSINAGSLRPETAFGYDLGADYRFHDGVTSLSGDVYLENLFNHFIAQLYPSGTMCPSVDPVTGTNTGCPPNTPLYYSSQTNLNNARFEGVELSLRRRPFVGLGYTLQGDLEKAYAYNLPPNFYCSFVPTPSKPCDPAHYNTNLAIIAGQNFTGNPIGANGFSNTNVPYATGYGELNYHFKGGSYALLGATYFGNNNSLFVPAFLTLNAGAGVRFGDGMQFQVTGYNINNKYNGVIPNYGGNPMYYPLANGQLAPTQGNVLGPAVYHFTLSKYYGQGANPNQ